MDKIPKQLIEYGKIGKWIINFNELIIEDKPFAHGSNCNVYNCKWRNLYIAVKCIKIENIKVLKNFFNEIEIWSTVRHPNLVQFLGFSIDEVNNIYYIMMEKINGIDLGTYIEKNILTYYKKLIISKQLATIIHFLHKCEPKIIYRDLKPDNILIDKCGNIKLIDLGLSRFMPENTSFVMTGCTGTLRYISPEVLNKKYYNLSTDVYSYGMIIFYLFSGLLPYSQRDMNQYFSFRNNKPYIISRIYRTKIKELISSCLHFDIDKRPSMNDICIILENMINSCCIKI